MTNTAPSAHQPEHEPPARPDSQPGAGRRKPVTHEGTGTARTAHDWPFNQSREESS